MKVCVKVDQGKWERGCRDISYGPSKLNQADTEYADDDSDYDDEDYNSAPRKKKFY